jgi:hypothetical protein
VRFFSVQPYGRFFFAFITFIAFTEFITSSYLSRICGRTACEPFRSQAPNHLSTLFLLLVFHFIDSVRASTMYALAISQHIRRRDFYFCQIGQNSSGTAIPIHWSSVKPI